MAFGDTAGLKNLDGLISNVCGMKFSFDALTRLGVPEEVLSWLESQFGNEDIEYQAALDAFACADLPDFAVGFSPTRCTTNPLGVKGAGEAAMGGIVPAIGNAIQDALAPLGVTTFDGPATPGRVWQAIRAARTAR